MKAFGLSLLWSFLVMVSVQASGWLEREEALQNLLQEQRHEEVERYIREQFLSRGDHSAELYEILATLAYDQQKLGQAALWLERAALFKGSSQEIRQNLNFIELKTGNLRFAESRLWQLIYSIFTWNQWVAIASIGIFTLLLGLTIACFSNRWAWSIMILGIIMSLSSLTVIYLHPYRTEWARRLVVTDAESAAYASAARTTDPLVNLPPGSTLRLLADRGEWLYVEIPLQPLSRGWVMKSQVAALWPYDLGYLR